MRTSLRTYLFRSGMKHRKRLGSRAFVQILGK
jgi:hypothetical protein